MSHDDRKSGDYPVGYGRPPRHTQWKKGQSGNPSGKKTRAKTMRDKLRAILGEKIVVTRNGVQTVMASDEAMLHAAVQKAIRGDTPTFKLIFAHASEGESGAEAVPELEVTDADIEVLKTEADFRGLVERAKAEIAAREDADDPEGSVGEHGDEGF